MSPRMLWTSLVAALVTVAAALALVGQPATAAPQLAQSAIDVTPHQEVYAVGDVVTVTVQLSNLQNFYGADLGWRFDAGAFQVIDANPDLAGKQVKAGSLFPGGSFFVQNVVDNQSGFVQFVGTRVHPEPPVNGGGTVAIVTFRVVGNCGDTLLELRPRLQGQPALGTLSLSDQGGGEIEFQEAIPFNLRTAACPYRQFLPHLSKKGG